jgi:2-polyprenyl-3-methyl-5-hydroxy-6-metoxy-1,4-benzoquinol methylase
VGECCDHGAYQNTFGARFARRTARRYRRRGLNRTQRSIVDFLARRGGLEGASVLEVGGGVGDLYIELLRRGASTVTNLEISTGYEAEATALLSESGMASRVTRLLHDIAIDSETVESADVVVLHRVVCCYPDYQRLLGAAASHARRLLVFSHPPSTALVRASFAFDNLLRRLRRNDFRGFVHPPAAMYSVANAEGLTQRLHQRGRFWDVAAFERRTALPAATDDAVATALPPA